MVLDWCGPHHVTGLHGSLYWLLSVCPYKGYRGKVGDDRIRFLKFDGYPEFTTEPSNAIMRAWKIDYDQSCYQVGEVERGHSIHQNAMRTMCSHAHSASLLWEELFKALDQNPGLVRDCFGMIGFRNMVGWKLVHHCVYACRRDRATCPAKTVAQLRYTRSNVPITGLTDFGQADSDGSNRGPI